MKCSFRISEPYIVMPDEIEPLDFIIDYVTLNYFAVKSIHVNGREFGTIKYALDARKSFERSICVSLPMLRMETHPCGMPVCEGYVRELDDGVSICAEHWELDRVYGVD